MSLDSIVYAFLRGESPEGIAESFPALGLEQVLGALAYYVANRADVDVYLSQGRRDFEALREQFAAGQSGILRKLADARQKSHA